MSQSVESVYRKYHVTPVEMSVPKIASDRIGPMFFQKSGMLRLYPASKMIGGRRKRVKKVGSKNRFASVSNSAGGIDDLIVIPTMKPIMIVMPHSGNHKMWF